MTDGDGWFLWKGGIADGHVCPTPDLVGFEKEAGWLRDFAWRCECGRFYVVTDVSVSEAAKCLRLAMTTQEAEECPVWAWRQAYPWERRGLRRRWEQQK